MNERCHQIARTPPCTAEGLTPNISRQPLRGIFVIGVLLCALFGSATYASGSIMILNSDQNVDKYLQVQKSFSETVQSEIEVINMNEQAITDLGLQQIIIKRNPDLIYCIGTRATVFATHWLSDRIKIVSSVLNLERLVMDNNTYGVSGALSAGMQINLFRLFFPGIRKIGVLYNEEYNGKWVASAIEHGRRKKIEITGVAVRKPVDVGWKLKKLLQKVDAVWLISDPVVMASERRIRSIFEQGERAKKPIFAYDDLYADLGAALIISADIPTIGGQVAELARDIFNDTSVITTRFQTPVGSEISINLKKIEEYGLAFDRQRILGMVNRIIE